MADSFCIHSCIGDFIKIKITVLNADHRTLCRVSTLFPSPVSVLFPTFSMLNYKGENRGKIGTAPTYTHMGSGLVSCKN